MGRFPWHSVPSTPRHAHAIGRDRRSGGMIPPGSLAVIVAGSLLISACSGGNPTAPGTVAQNMPPGAVGASNVKPEVAATAIVIKGQLMDAHTGDAPPKAKVIVQFLSSDILATPVASGMPTASGSLGGAPGMPPPVPVPSSDVTATPQPFSNGGRQGVTAPRRQPLPPDDPRKARTITPNSDGTFEIKDAAPGTYQFTAYAPGYQAISVVLQRPSSLDFHLLALKSAGGFDVAGTVQSAANKPAPNVTVVAGSEPGLTVGDSTTTDSDGAFSLKDLKMGKTPIAGFTGEQGEIKTWALQPDVPIGVGDKKKPPSPQLTLKAVTAPVILSGKVLSTIPELRPRQVTVDLVTASEREKKSYEIPLLTRTPDKEGYFRFSLPALGEGQTYHLVATGVTINGDVAYVHKHNQNPVETNKSATDTKLELTLPKLLKAPRLDMSADPILASWDPLDEASAYRVRVETIDDNPVTLWEGFTQQTSMSLPDPSVLTLLKTGERYRLTLTAIQVLQGGNGYTLDQLDRSPWAFAVSHSPIEFTYGSALDAPRAATGDLPVITPPGTGSLHPVVKAVPVVKPTKPAKPAKPTKTGKAAKAGKLAKPKAPATKALTLKKPAAIAPLPPRPPAVKPMPIPPAPPANQGGPSTGKP